MIGLLATLAVFQAVERAPIRFLVSHSEIPEAARALLGTEMDHLEAEARKQSFSVRKQSDSIAIYQTNLFDVDRVDLALKGQRALAELIRQKRSWFTLQEFSGDARRGLEELMRKGAPVAGTAALDPKARISIGFHYYVTLEFGGKSVEDVIAVDPPAVDRAAQPTESKEVVDASPPPDINRLSVAWSTSRTPSQRRTRALAELMQHFMTLSKGKTKKSLRPLPCWRMRVRGIALFPRAWQRMRWMSR